MCIRDRYKDHRDKSIKKRNFNNFIAKLEKFYIVALSKIITSLGKTYKKFKYYRRKFGYSDERLQQINLYNAVINRINLRIILLQDAVFWSDDYDLYNKKLNSLIYRDVYKRQVLIGVQILIWLPFFKISDAQALKEEENLSA